MSERREPDDIWRLLVYPLRVGWIAILNFMRDDGPQRAGHIAFATLLALFPFLIFLTTVAGFLGQREIAADFIAFAFEIMPLEVALAINPALVEVLDRTRGELLTLSLIGTLWVASSGVEALRGALNRAYAVRRPRPIWYRRLQGFAFVVLGSIAILLGMIGVVAGPVIWSFAQRHLGLPEPWESTWTGLRYGVVTFGLFVVLCCLYRWLPGRTQRWRLVLPGAAVAVVSWLIAASLFSLYLARAANFTMTYGSLGGIVVTLVFFYVNAAVVIYGAEYNAAFAGKALRPPTDDDVPPPRQPPADASGGDAKDSA